MSKTIVSKTKGNVFVEELGEPMDDAQIYVESAPSANVFTGSTEGKSSTVTFIGSGAASLKLVAAGTSLGSSLSIGAADTVTRVTIDNVKVGTIYGGALATDGKGKILTKYVAGTQAVVAGDVELKILNGNYTNVYGGGGGYGATVKGDVTITYGCGSFVNGDRVGTIYGGGAAGSVVEGDVSINISGAAAGKIGSIYAGGNNSVVKGNAVVTFTATAGLYSFNGTVSGGGKGSKARVEGSSTLVFDDYRGDFKATIKEFSTVQFVGSTSVTMTKAQNKTMKAATYEFVITDESRGLSSAMLTLTRKTTLSKVLITVDSEYFTANGGTVILISSKYFKTATDVNVDTFTVHNGEGNAIYSGAYELVYNYDKKLGGSVTFVFKGANLIIDSEVKENITLTDADEELNIVAGAEVIGNIDMSDGDDTLNIQSGAKVYGSIKMGAGNDYLVIQKDSLVTGTIDMGTGNDTIVLQEYALVSSEIFLRDGENMMILEKGSEHSGTIVFDANSKNTIHVNGGAISSVRGGDETTYNEIILSGISGLGGGIGTWITNSKGERVFLAQELVLKGSTNDTVILNKYAEVAGINFGKGEDTLVLNREYDGDVVFEDGGDAIVVGTNLTLDGRLLKLRGTNNILVITNGNTATIENMTIGDFADPGSSTGFFSGIFLSQNAGLFYNGRQFIQNYTGNLDAGDLVIIGDMGDAPDRIADYYDKQTDGVENTAIKADSVDVSYGAKVSSSSILTGDMVVREDAVVSDSRIDAEELTLEGGASVSGSLIEVGSLRVSKGAAVTGGTLLFHEDAYVAGTVAVDLYGCDEDNTLTIAAGAAFTTNRIDLGDGFDTVSFTAGFENAALVLLGVELIEVGNDASIVIGSAEGSAFDLGKNSMIEETITQTVTVGDWTKAVTFKDGYTINLNGAIGVNVALSNNTVVITDGNTGYFAKMIALSGSNTFRIADKVATWYDWQQFTGATDQLKFELGTGSFFAVDGYVPAADSDMIKANTVFGDNSALGLGDTVYIQNWDGFFRIDDIATFPTYGQNVLAWTNLEVLANGQVWGRIVMNDGDNAVVLNDGVVVNGNTDFYDFAAINTGAGDDSLMIGKATVNGRIRMGEGDNVLVMNGATVNKAINQVPAILEVGTATSENEVFVTDSLLDGDVRFRGATEGTIANTEITGDLDFGVGADNMAISDSTIGGDLSFGGGADIVDISGTKIGGDVDFGAGNDEVTLTGTTVGGDVDFGAGFDEATLDSSDIAGDVILNGGEFNIVNGTTVGGDVDFVGNFNEVIAGDAAVAGDLLMGDGVNILSVEGAFSANGIVGNEDAVGNSVTVETGGALTLAAGDVELFAEFENLVGVDGGVINMDGNITLTGGGNSVVLLEGGSINGLKELVMDADDDNVIFVDGGSTLAASSIEMAGSINEVTLSDGGSIAGLESLYMESSEGNTIAVDSSDFVADSVTMISASGNKISETQGSVSVAERIIMFGQRNEVETDTAFAAGSLLMGGQENTITNAGNANFAGMDLVIDPTTTITEVSVVMEGDENSIVNAETGVFTAKKILMGGDDNSIATDGAFTATDIIMLGEGANSIENNGAMAADSIAMTGESNKISFGQTASLTATNGIVMDGDYNEFTAFNYFKAGYNDYSTVGELVYESTVDVGDVDVAITGDVTMTGGENYFELGFQAVSDGSFYNTPGDWFQYYQLEALVTVGAVNVTLDGALNMDGDSNEAYVNLWLDATREGDIKVNGGAVISVGDVTMTGADNTFSATFLFRAHDLASLDLGNNDFAISVGDVSMDTGLNGAGSTNYMEIGSWISYEATPGWPMSYGEIKNLGNVTLTAGDITMHGAGAENELQIFDNAEVTGAIEMGNVVGDTVTKSNLLELENGKITGNSIKMVAESNTIILNGSGTLAQWVDIQGGVNSAVIGEDFTVSDVITFGSVYDADQYGVEGYEIAKNTENNVEVYGKVGGINTASANGTTILNDSEDTILVSGIVDGDILTGLGSDSVALLEGTVSGSITMGDDSLLVPDANGVMPIESNSDVNDFYSYFGTVGGAVAMTGYLNDLEVEATEIAGDVTMTAYDENDAAFVVGRYEEYDADGNLVSFTEKGSKVGGDLTMVSIDDDNNLDIQASEVTGKISMTSLGDDNWVTIGTYDFEVGTDPDTGLPVYESRGSVVGNGIEMSAYDDNGLDIYFSTVTGGIIMDAGYYNDLEVYASTITGDVVLTAVDDNTVEFRAGMYNGVMTGTLVDGNVSMESEEGDNELTIAGDLSADPDTNMDILTETKVTGQITMTANEDNGWNKLRLEYVALVDGQIAMQGYGASITIVTGEWKRFGSTTVDSSTYLKSVSMTSTGNEFVVEEGTVVVTDTVDGTFGMKLEGNENYVTVAAKGRLIMADSAADMTGPNAPVPTNVDPTTGRQGIFMGATSQDLTPGTDDKYLFTEVQFYGTYENANGQEVYIFQLGGGTADVYTAILADSNELAVEGKLLTGAIEMIAAENTVTVTGPAESTVDGAYPAPPTVNTWANWAEWMNNTFSWDVMLQSTSTIWAESMTLNGVNNSIEVSAESITRYVSPNNVTVPLSGASLMVGGDITMDGATVKMFDKNGNPLPDQYIAAESNLFDMGELNEMTFFKSANISMTALDSNDANLSGYLFRGYAPFTQNGNDFDYQAPYWIQSEVDGDITMTAMEGYNDLDLELVNVSGDIVMVATAAEGKNSGWNNLYVGGELINEIADPNDPDNPLFNETEVRSAVGGDIAMFAKSDDVALETDNDLYVGYADVAGDVVMVSENGENYADVWNSTVGNVTMIADALADTNSFGNTLYAYRSDMGDLEMTTENGDNDAYFNGANVGDVTMTANAIPNADPTQAPAVNADNYLEAEVYGSLDNVSTFGDITMLADRSNYAVIEGYIQQGVLNADGDALETPMVVGKAATGSISMTAVREDNELELELVDVAGDIDMTGKANELSITGGAISQVVANDGTELVAADIVRSTVDGDITLDAFDGSNLVSMQAVDVTGKVTMTADAVYIDADTMPLSVGNMIQGTLVSMDELEMTALNGGNQAMFIAAAIGDVTMTASAKVPGASDNWTSAVDASNILLAPAIFGVETVSDFGDITMTADAANSVLITGAIQQGVLNAAGDALETAQVTRLSEIGSLSMTSDKGGNEATLELVEMADGITMDAYTTNVLQIIGGVVNQVLASDGVTELVAADTVYSTIAGGISMTATVGNAGANLGSVGNSLELNTVDVYGDIVMTATGEYVSTTVGPKYVDNNATIVNSEMDGLTMTAGNGSNYANFTGTTVYEAISMDSEAMVPGASDTWGPVGAGNNLTAVASNANEVNNFYDDIEMTTNGNNLLNIGGWLLPSEGTIGNADWADASPVFSAITGDVTMTATGGAANGGKNEATLDKVLMTGDFTMDAKTTNALTVKGAEGDVSDGQATPGVISEVFEAKIDGDVTMTAMGGEVTLDFYGDFVSGTASNALVLEKAVVTGDVAMKGIYNTVTVDADSVIDGTLSFADADATTAINAWNAITVNGEITWATGKAIAVTGSGEIGFSGIATYIKSVANTISVTALGSAAGDAITIEGSITLGYTGTTLAGSVVSGAASWLTLDATDLTGTDTLLSASAGFTWQSLQDGVFTLDIEAADFAAIGSSLQIWDNLEAGAAWGGTTASISLNVDNVYTTLNWDALTSAYTDGTWSLAVDGNNDLKITKIA